MSIRAQVRLTARGTRLIAKLAAGSARSREVARTAINSTLKRTKPKAVRAIRGRVALPRDYVSERLREVPASTERLEGKIGTPKRSVLLTRFAHRARTLTRRRTRTRKGRGKRGDAYQARAGVRVTVRPGRAKLMPGAFLIRLRAGAEPGQNVGIAIRRRGAKGRSNYTVRYGPSLASVYRRVKGDLQPGAEAEFRRTFSFLIKREFSR